MTQRNLGDILAPFLSGHLAEWQGLPAISTGELEVALGGAAERDTSPIGAYPAECWRYPQPGERMLLVYVRHGQVIMVEVLPPCDYGAVVALGEPTAILPQEISVAGAYAHEYLYAARGLLLTVAVDLDAIAPDRVVRCRGIRPLANARELGAELYWPLDLDVQWNG